MPGAHNTVRSTVQAGGSPQRGATSSGRGVRADQPCVAALAARELASDAACATTVTALAVVHRAGTLLAVHEKPPSRRWNGRSHSEVGDTMAERGALGKRRSMKLLQARGFAGDCRPEWVIPTVVPSERLRGRWPRHSLCSRAEHRPRPSRVPRWSPLAISRQNSRSTSRRWDGAPGDRIGPRPVNSVIHPAGLPIHTSRIEVLRRPVESALNSLIGVNDRPGVRPLCEPGIDGHAERIGDQRCPRRCVDRPTHDAA